MRVSAVVNVSGEGMLLNAALESAIRSIGSSGFAQDCELIIVADNASRLTLDTLHAYQEHTARVIETDFADLGPARNAGVNAATGDLVLFLDGDDLWGRNWVRACWEASRTTPVASVMHPQYCVYFGGSKLLVAHPDWRDQGFDIRGIITDNYWSALCGAPRSILIETPYPAADHRLRFGYEDWSWNAETWARGVRHVTVSGTVHFIRVKQVASMQTDMLAFEPIPSVAFAEYLAWDSPSRPHDL